MVVSTLHLVPVQQRTVPSVLEVGGAALLTEVQGAMYPPPPVHLGERSREGGTA